MPPPGLPWPSPLCPRPRRLLSPSRWRVLVRSLRLPATPCRLAPSLRSSAKSLPGLVGPLAIRLLSVLWLHPLLPSPGLWPLARWTLGWARGPQWLLPPPPQPLALCRHQHQGLCLLPRPLRPPVPSRGSGVPLPARNRAQATGKPGIPVLRDRPVAAQPAWIIISTRQGSPRRPVVRGQPRPASR